MRLLIASISARTSAGEGSGVKDDRTSTWRGGKASADCYNIIVVPGIVRSTSSTPTQQGEAGPISGAEQGRPRGSSVSRLHAQTLQLASARASYSRESLCDGLAKVASHLRVGKMDVLFG